MRLSAQRKYKFYRYLKLIKIKKWRMLVLLFLTLFLLTISFLRIMPTRLTKTTLIFNNKNICNSDPRKLHRLPAKEDYQRSIVIVVLSRRKNFVKRNLIRNTWGSIRSVNNITILAVVFMLGSMDGPEDDKIDFSQLETEMIEFGDLVIGDFVDTYRNLTRKTIMAYEWLTSFCQKAQIVVKTDDDVVINVFKLTEELNAWTSTEMTASNFWCAVHWLEKVNKNKESIHYVSSEEYAGDIFPNHCAGVGYVTPMGVIHRILDEISRSFVGTICTHEDVFMTGIVPEKINSIRSTQNEPIGRIDSVPWVTYDLLVEQGENAEFLIELLEQQPDEMKNLDEFRQRFMTYIFYLLREGSDFEYRFERLWQVIKKTFYNNSIL